MFTTFATALGVLMFSASVGGVAQHALNYKKKKASDNYNFGLYDEFPREVMDGMIDHFMTEGDDWVSSDNPFDKIKTAKEKAKQVEEESKERSKIHKQYMSNVGGLIHRDGHHAALAQRAMQYGHSFELEHAYQKKLDDIKKEWEKEAHNAHDLDMKLREHKQVLSTIIRLYYEMRELIPEEERFKLRAKEELVKNKGVLKLSELYPQRPNGHGITVKSETIQPININGKLYT